MVEAFWTALLSDDRLLLRPGEQVPVDGLVTEGESSIDESMVTGESISVSKEPGDQRNIASDPGDARRTMAGSRRGAHLRSGPDRRAARGRPKAKNI